MKKTLCDHCETFASIASIAVKKNDLTQRRGAKGKILKDDGSFLCALSELCGKLTNPLASIAKPLRPLG